MPYACPRLTEDLVNISCLCCLQITSPAGPAVTFIGMPPRPVSNDDKKRLAVQVLTSRTLKRSISNAVTEAESDEARWVDVWLLSQGTLLLVVLGVYLN